MQILASALFALAGLIKLAPVIGVLSAARLEGLYGLPFEDENLLVLMRHRAVLFGVVGGILLGAAFHRPLRPLAFIVGLVSSLSFILLTYQAVDPNSEIRGVAVADVVVFAAVVGGTLLSRPRGATRDGAA